MKTEKNLHLTKLNNSIRIINRSIIESKLVFKEIKELSESDLKNLMNICSYAMSFDRKYVSNLIMVNIILKDKERDKKNFTKRLYRKYKLKNSLTIQQRLYYEQIILFGRRKSIQDNAVQKEVVAYIDKFSKREEIKNVYLKNGIDFNKLKVLACKYENDISKLESYIVKKTSNVKVIEHFRKIVSSSEDNISNINSICIKDENNRELKRRYLKKDEIKKLSDIDKTFIVIERLLDKKSQIYKLLMNENIPIEKRLKLISSFAYGNIYNSTSCESSFLINILNRDKNRLKQICREAIRRYISSKRYIQIHKDYLESCLKSGWGDTKRENHLGKLVKTKFTGFAKYKEIRAAFKSAGIEVDKFITTLQWDHTNWKKNYIRQMGNIDNKSVRKILRKILNDAQFEMTLIEQDLYCLRENAARKYLPGRKK